MSTTYDFSIGSLRDFSHSLLPPEAVDSPFKTHDAEYRRLLGLYDEAVAELRKIVWCASEAAEADRVALAQSMAAGEPDPGDRSTADLYEQFNAQQRKVAGLADAIDAAYDGLRAAIDKHADDWVTALANDAAKSGKRIDELLRELGKELDRTSGARNAVKWLERALALGDRRDLPSQSASGTTVDLGQTPWPHDQVFTAIRASARFSGLRRIAM